MLVEFRVENFRNFREELIYKLNDIKKYNFNQEAIKSNIAKNCLIYGSNNSGKTNLGLAIFDISFTLSDKDKEYVLEPYTNLYSSGTTKFYYKFKFDSLILTYKYEKSNDKTITTEEVFVNDRRVVHYDHRKRESEIDWLNSIICNYPIVKSGVSIMKGLRNYLELISSEYRNIFIKIFDFVDHMRLFSDLDSNEYIEKYIIEKKKIKQLEKFLREFEIQYTLVEGKNNEEKIILCDYAGTKVNFNKVASRGTCNLILCYYIILQLEEASFVFIDDFALCYHEDVARGIIKKIVDSRAQVIMTTYNTYLMSNDILRPDCCFQLKDGKIGSFSNSTLKELRKAHNIEKMYRAGVFE